MQLIKKVMTCTLSAALIFSSIIGGAAPAEASDNQLNIKINNILYNEANQPTPVNINGRVYVPLRLVSEGLGHSVVWDNATRTILIDSNLSQIDTTTALSSLVIYIDNKQLQVDTETGQPFITPQGYTMVPIRVIAENLGANVVWANSTQTVEISTQTPTIIDTPVENSQETASTDTQDEQPASETTTTEDTVSLSADQVTIMGDSYSTLDQMKRFTAAKEAEVKARAQANGDDFIPFPENIAEYYYTIGKKYNIRGDVALAQAMLETGCFQYGNEVKSWQNNFCGLGATGAKVTEEDCETYAYSLINHDRAWLVPGMYGWFYDSVATGVEAHIQHLYSYATTAELPSGVERLDGRFYHGNRGKGIYLTDLNGRWAVPGDNYGQNIFSSYLEPMMNS